MITARAHAAIDQVLQLQDFFDRSALAQPDAIAVEVPPAAARPQRRRITYGELKRRSDVLAGRIRDSVAESSVVAVLLPRTTELLYVAQLAVLKSGAAFLCIDPAFPREHVRHILDDAQVAVLLTDAEGFERGRQMGYSGSIIRVDSPAVTSDETPPCSPSPPQSPDAAAYVIYTSGTTGEPKGVLIAHRSICNLVESDVEEFQLGPSDRVAQGSSAAYDSSIEET
ncbi:MAG: AMP-binding protein, partial [Gemmatimonadota bacterium]